MIKEAIEKITEMARPEVVKVDGLNYTTSKLYEAKDPVQAPMTINTLTGIVDYLKSDADKFHDDRAPAFVHVADHDTVKVLTALYGNFDQRAVVITAHTDIQPFSFGRWFEVEDFVIGLKSLFDHTQDIENILTLVSGLREESSRELKDDGITQRTTVRRGTGAIADAQTVKGFVTLKPFRTFMEVDQPESRFVFRDYACENSGVVRFENKNEMVMATEYQSGAYRVQAVDFDAVVNDDSLYLTTAADKIEIEVIGKLNIVVENGEIVCTGRLGK